VPCDRMLLQPVAMGTTRQVTIIKQIARFVLAYAISLTVVCLFVGTIIGFGHHPGPRPFYDVFIGLLGMTGLIAGLLGGIFAAASTWSWAYDGLSLDPGEKSMDSSTDYRLTRSERKQRAKETAKEIEAKRCWWGKESPTRCSAERGPLVLELSVYCDAHQKLISSAITMTRGNRRHQVRFVQYG